MHACFSFVGKLGNEKGKTYRYGSYVEALSYNACGCDDNVIRTYRDVPGKEVTHFFSNFYTVGVTRICVAAVADDRLSDTVGNVAFSNRERRAFYKVRCIYRRRGSGNFAIDEGKVAFRFVSTYTAMNACRRKSFCGANAAFYDLHFKLPRLNIHSFGDISTEHYIETFYSRAASAFAEIVVSCCKKYAVFVSEN
jgi:hypothetical protein